MMHRTNPLLQEERDRCEFNVKQLTHFIDSGYILTDKRKYLENIINSDPDFKCEKAPECMSREELLSEMMRLSLAVIKIVKEYGIFDRDSMPFFFRNALMFYQSPIYLHFILVLPTVFNQASVEQQERWLPKMLDVEIIGSYAQTELGHGTYLKGIETTATYDVQTEQFILNTPTVTATKWWPGGLGKAANYAVVLANLFLGGKNVGPHMFMVQLRNIETHRVLPTIEVGDIGPKLAFNEVDNGYLRLNFTRIPRKNMFARYAEVLPDGTYQRKQCKSKNGEELASTAGSERTSYGTMVLVRAILSIFCYQHLSAGVTIAVRYSSLRQQGVIDAPPNGDNIEETVQLQDSVAQTENKLLDYETQQLKLAYVVSLCYGMLIVGKRIYNLYFEVNERQFENFEDQKQYLQDVPDLHSLSAGMKAYCTILTTSGLLTCRRACGGHGFLTASGLPQLFGAMEAATTYEGDNTVLFLQNGRFLMRLMNPEKVRADAFGSIPYISPDSVNHSTLLPNDASCDFWSVDFYLSIVSLRARYVIEATSKIFYDDLANNVDLSFEAAIVKHNIMLEKLGKVHCEYFLISTFKNALKDPEFINICPDLKTQSVMCDLYRLMASIHLFEASGECIAASAAGCGGGDRYSPNSIHNNPQLFLKQLQQQTRKCIVKLRPNLVGLVDAFDIPDRTLNSQLGRFDGQVYENLLASARKSNLNDKEVFSAFEEHMVPFRKLAKTAKL